MYTGISNIIDWTDPDTCTVNLHVLQTCLCEILNLTIETYVYYTCMYMCIHVQQYMYFMCRPDHLSQQRLHLVFGNRDTIHNTYVPVFISNLYSSRAVGLFWLRKSTPVFIYSSSSVVGLLWLKAHLCLFIAVVQ